MSDSAGYQYVDPPSGYEGNLRWMDWRGLYVKVGPGFGPSFFNMIAARQRKGRSCVVLVSGEPGIGKTWIALRLAEIFDKKFRILDTPAPPPEEDPSQVTFGREHLLHLIGKDSPLRRGQAIVIDETQFQLNARRFAEEDQKSLTEILAAVRSKGYLLFIVALHGSLLDKVIRDYVLNFQIHVVDRGVGEVYELFMPKFENKLYHPGVATLRLQVPGFESCESPDCLRCPHLDGRNGAVRCFNIRALYERRKSEAVDVRSHSAAQNIRDKREVDPEKVIASWVKRGGEIVWSKRGLPEIASLQKIISEELGQSLGRNKTTILSKRLLAEHPEVTPSVEAKQVEGKSNE